MRTTDCPMLLSAGSKDASQIPFGSHVQTNALRFAASPPPPGKTKKTHTCDMSAPLAPSSPTPNPQTPPPQGKEQPLRPQKPAQEELLAQQVRDQKRIALDQEMPLTMSFLVVFGLFCFLVVLFSLLVAFGLPGGFIIIPGKSICFP